MRAEKDLIEHCDENAVPHEGDQSTFIWCCVCCLNSPNYSAVPISCTFIRRVASLNLVLQKTTQ